MCDISKDELKRLYIGEHLSALKIASKYGVSYSVIYRLLDKYNIPRRNNHEKGKLYTANSTFFDVIDNDEKAYWFGFLCADGYIQSATDYVGLSLGACDKDHLYKFNKSLTSSYPIKEYEVGKSGFGVGARYVRTVIADQHLSIMLQSKGCIKNKSGKLLWPTDDIVPLQYKLSYLLGYIDGNGSITFGNKDHTYLKIKICGTKEFLSDAIDFINTQLDGYLPVKHTLEKRHDNDFNSYQFSINGPVRCCLLLDKMYKVSPIHLDRKYNKYQEYIQNNGRILQKCRVFNPF